MKRKIFPILRSEHRVYIENKTKVEIDWLLKSLIFVVQRAAAPKNGLEFPQRFIGAIRCCVATSYDDVRSRATLVPLLTNQKFVMVGIKLILVIGFSQAKHQVDQNLDFD